MWTKCIDSENEKQALFHQNHCRYNDCHSIPVKWYGYHVDLLYRWIHVQVVLCYTGIGDKSLHFVTYLSQLMSKALIPINHTLFIARHSKNWRQIYFHLLRINTFAYISCVCVFMKIVFSVVFTNRNLGRLQSTRR